MAGVAVKPIHTSRGGEFLGTMGVLLFGLLAIIVAIATSFQNETDPAAVCLCIVALAGMVSAVHLGNTVIAFFNSVCFFLILYPFLLQYGNGVNLSGFGLPRQLGGAAALSYAIFIAGVTIAGLLPAPRSTRDHKFYIASSVIPSIIAVICGILFLSIFGSSQIFSSRTEFSVDSVQDNGPFLFLGNVFKLIPYWLSYIALCSRLNRRKPLLSLDAVICFGVGFLICNPFNSARFISLAAMVVVSIPFLIRMNLLSKLPLLFPFLMVVLLPITSVLRYGFDMLTWENIIGIFHSTEFSSLQVLNDGFRYMDIDQWGLGYYTLSGLMVFVPRSLWPAKNVGTGLTIGERAGYPETNVGVPPHFELYLDFGMIAVVCFAIIVGLVLRQAWRASHNGQKLGSSRSDLFALVIAALPIFVRGDLATAMVGIYSFLAAYAVARSALMIMRASSSSRRTAPRQYRGIASSTARAPAEN